MFEIWNVLRESAVHGQPRGQAADRRTQALMRKLVFINFFVFLFPLIVVNYYFTYGAPLWLLASELGLGLIALGVQIYIYWQLKWRPQPKIENAESLISWGLSEDVARFIKNKVQRAWLLSIASFIPIVFLFTGPASIVEASQALYLSAATDLGHPLRRSALWARRLTTFLLVIYAVIVTLLPLVVFIYLKRQALH